MFLSRPALTILGAAASVAAIATATPAHAAEPALTVPAKALAAALVCTDGVEAATRTPIMLVTGTGVTGEQAYAFAKGAFDAYGAPVCRVSFPHATTGDLQITVQYLVAGLRTMARRAGRKVAVVGVSQGALLPRIALTYWPSLRTRVDDVVAVAGPQHGTTVAGFAGCRGQGLACVPAAWQQAAGSHVLRALDARPDETPGPTSWTTVRSGTDEVVQPTGGPHPTSALDGATNIRIQGVCPGRAVSHVGTALDSVTFAALDDALRHAGPARVSRLPDAVCAKPFAPGLDEPGTRTLLAALEGRAGGGTPYPGQPTVRREPALRPWVTRGR